MTLQPSIQLIPNERIIAVEANGSLILTTHRVRCSLPGFEGARFTSMTLDAVASAGIVTTSNIWLLAVGLILGLLGFIVLLVQSGNQIILGATAMFIAAGLLAVYFVTRRAVLAIDSAGQTITVPFNAANRSRLGAFIDMLEGAKLSMRPSQL